MKDCSQKEGMSAQTTLDVFLDGVCNGSMGSEGEGYHDRAAVSGFAVSGFEDGLFVTADLQTYMGFARMMRTHQKVSRKVEWRHLNGRIASACIAETSGPNKRVSFLSILHFETGWKIISQTFEAKTDGGL